MNLVIEVTKNPPPHTSTTHKETFQHIREPQVHIGNDKKGNEKFRWSGCTVFARLEEDGWHCAAALCLETDQFCRRTGRTIARRHYFKPKVKKEDTQNLKLNIPTDKYPPVEVMRMAYLHFCMQALEHRNHRA